MTVAVCCSLGHPLTKLADKSLDPEEKTMLLYKFGIIRHLIGRTNVGVWRPSQSRMFFCLPQELIPNSDDYTCLAVSVPLGRDRIETGRFSFHNSLWNEIENEIENGGEEYAGLELHGKEAVDWTLSHTKEPGAMIFTHMKDTDWEIYMDPSQSKEAVAAIRETLVTPRM